MILLEKVLRKRRGLKKGGSILDYVLKAETVAKIYGHHKALDNFSIHIPKGAIYGLVGKKWCWQNDPASANLRPARSHFRGIHSIRCQ